LLGDIGRRTHLFSIRSLGQPNTSLFEILAFQRFSIWQIGKRLKGSILFISTIQAEIIVRLITTE
jgi:hypothetical protein